MTISWVREIPRLAGSAFIGGVVIIVASVGLRAAAPAHAQQRSTPPPPSGFITQTGPGSAATNGPNSPATVYNDNSHHTEYKETSPLPPSLQRIVLKPDNVAVRLGTCELGLDNDYLAFLAGHNAVIPARFPAIILSIDDNPVIVINKIGKNISIDQLYLYDANYQPVLTINQDKIWLSPLISADLVGKSGLVVHSGAEELFKIWYANKHDIFVGGKFRFPGSQTLYTFTDENAQRIMPNHPLLIMGGNCIKGFRGLQSIFPAG